MTDDTTLYLGHLLEKSDESHVSQRFSVLSQQSGVLSLLQDLEALINLTTNQRLVLAKLTNQKRVSAKLTNQKLYLGAELQRMEVHLEPVVQVSHLLSSSSHNPKPDQSEVSNVNQSESLAFYLTQSFRREVLVGG